MKKMKNIKKAVNKMIPLERYRTFSISASCFEQLNRILNNLKWSKKKKDLITYYVYLGVSPDLIVRYINPKMKTDTIYRVLELLFWDKDPYSFTNFVIENIENGDSDFAFPSIFADALVMKDNLSRYINLFKDAPKEKREFLFIMSTYFDKIDSDEQVLKILKENTFQELFDMFKSYILSIDYNDIHAYNGSDARAMSLYWGVANKNVGKERMNKFIKLEHTEDQIDYIIRALINIDDDSVMDLISDPRNDPFDIEHMTKFYLNKQSHKISPLDSKKK